MQFKIWRGEGGKQLRQKVYYGRCTNRGNFPPPGSIILTRLLSSRSLILATCDNLTSKSHYSRVYNFVWGLERHGPVRIDGWCFSFGKVTHVSVVTVAVDTNLFKAMHFFNISLFSRLLFLLPHFVPPIFLLR